MIISTPSGPSSYGNSWGNSFYRSHWTRTCTSCWPPIQGMATEFRPIFHTPTLPFIDRTRPTLPLRLSPFPVSASWGPVPPGPQYWPSAGTCCYSGLWAWQQRDRYYHRWYHGCLSNARNLHAGSTLSETLCPMASLIWESRSITRGCVCGLLWCIASTMRGPAVTGGRPTLHFYACSAHTRRSCLISPRRWSSWKITGCSGYTCKPPLSGRHGWPMTHPVDQRWIWTSNCHRRPHPSA